MSKTQIFSQWGKNKKGRQFVHTGARGRRGFSPELLRATGTRPNQGDFFSPDLLRHHSSKRRDATTCPSHLVFLSPQVGKQKLNQHAALPETPGKGAEKNGNCA